MVSAPILTHLTLQLLPWLLNLACSLPIRERFVFEDHFRRPFRRWLHRQVILSRRGY